MKIFIQALKIIFILTLVCAKTNAQPSNDTISFETSSSTIVIDTAGNNLWQIGQPQKIFFDAAHSGLNAIVTDTLNVYPPSSSSSFIYIIPDPYTQTCLTCMEFWHKYDMESPDDKGLIHASYDGGNSWVMVKDTFVQDIGSTFFWNDDYHEINGNATNHPLITTGTSDGWIKSSFCWEWYIPVSMDTIIRNPDTLLIRFTFISDSISDNKEGWMIDDIVTDASAPCGSVKENVLDAQITVYPNPFSTQSILQSERDLKKAGLSMYNLVGQLVKQWENISTRSIILYREDLPGGLYFLKVTESNKILKTIKILITDN